MIAASIGFVLVNLALLAMGFLIRNKGMTWLIAGYDASRVRDEKGLAGWVGSGLMVIGASGFLAGALIPLLPDYFFFVLVIAFVVVVVGGGIRLLCGMHKFVK